MKSKNNIFIKNAWLCQVTDNDINPIFCDVMIEKGKINGIRRKNFNNFIDSKRKSQEKGYNANGRVITIPLINFHDHFYSRLAKGQPVLGPMDNFSNILNNLWWKLDKSLDLEMIKASSQMAALESIRNGVTYIFDHHASPSVINGSLATIANTLRQYGLRGSLCYEISDRDGSKISQEGIKKTIEFINDQTDEDIKGMAGLHASFTLNNNTLEKVSEIIKQYNIGIHIHLCEDNIDNEKSFDLYNLTPVERLIKYNLLNEKSILSHGVHLLQEDYSKISESRSALAYNPDSNLNNGVGLPKFNLVPNSVPILAGTDGMHADVAKSLKQLFLLYRYQKNNFESAFKWFHKIYFDQLKFVRHYFPDFTSLRIGSRGDFIIWDYIPPTPISQSNFWGHFVYGILERPVRSVINKGKYLMKDFKILVTDEDKVYKNIYLQGKRLNTKLKKLMKNENDVSKT